MIRVYQAFNNLLPTPLTIIAETSDDASRIFQIWAEHHRPVAKATPSEFKVMSPAELVLQPQLAEAAGAGLEGIAYWVSHGAGWVVAAPHEPAAGAFAPFEVDVRCYGVMDEDGELLVFALNSGQAVAFYNHWCLTAHGAVSTYFTVEEVSRWLLKGPKITLREEMEAGLLGVGAESDDGYWRVYPPDYKLSLNS